MIDVHSEEKSGEPWNRWPIKAVLNLLGSPLLFTRPDETLLRHLQGNEPGTIHTRRFPAHIQHCKRCLFVRRRGVPGSLGQAWERVNERRSTEGRVAKTSVMIPRRVLGKTSWRCFDDFKHLLGYFSQTSTIRSSSTYPFVSLSRLHFIMTLMTLLACFSVESFLLCWLQLLSPFPSTEPNPNPKQTDNLDLDLDQLAN